MKIKKLRAIRDENGNAMIEMAVFLPVMVTLLLGAVNFGVLLNDYLRVCDSARSGAEAATTRVWTNKLDYVRLVANSSATNIPGYAVTATQYCLCGPGGSQISCTSHSACGSYGIPNQYVQVTATAQLPLILKVPGFPSSYPVKSVAIARVPWTGTT